MKEWDFDILDQAIQVVEEYAKNLEKQEKQENNPLFQIFQKITGKNAK